jgi:hypothetical protein
LSTESASTRSPQCAAPKTRKAGALTPALHCSTIEQMNGRPRRPSGRFDSVNSPSGASFRPFRAMFMQNLR